MNRVKLGVSAAVFVSAFCLLALLPTIKVHDVSGADVANAAQDQRQVLLSGVSSGKILYLRTETYRRDDPSITASNPWDYPEQTQGEIWMGIDSNGDFTTYTTVSRNSDGEVLTHSKLESGNRVLTWVPTGAEISAPVADISHVTLADWIESVWRTETARTLDTEYSHAGYGTRDGKRTVAFEKEAVITLPTASELQAMGLPAELPPARTLVRRSEHMVDDPLLYQTSTFEKDASGERTLDYSFRVVSYQMLPADTQIVSFTNDGN